MPFYCVKWRSILTGLTGTFPVLSKDEGEKLVVELNEKYRNELIHEVEECPEEHPGQKRKRPEYLDEDSEDEE